MVPVTGMEMVLARAHSHPRPAQGWRDWANGWKNRTWESVDSFSRQTGKLARKNPMTAATTLVLGLAAFRNPSVALSHLQQGITFLPRRGMQGLTALFRISPLGTLIVGSSLGARLFRAAPLLAQNTRQFIQNPRRYCQMLYEQKRAVDLLAKEMPHIQHLLRTRLSSPVDILHYGQLWDQQIDTHLPKIDPLTWAHMRELFDIRIALCQDIRDKVGLNGFSALDDYTPSEPLLERIRQYKEYYIDRLAPETLEEARLKSPYAKRLLECETKEEFKRMRHEFSLEMHPDKTRGQNDEQQSWINQVVKHICWEKNW
jgi:hypothetical protein